MMFTCSALRCSVFEGSAISGTSGDSGAGDPTAPQGIPDAVLYTTVDDQALSDVLRNLEHPADLPLDAPRDIRPSGGREFRSLRRAQDRRGRDWDRGNPGLDERVHDDAIELLDVLLDARRRDPFRGGHAAFVQLVPAGEDVSIGAGAVDDQQRLSDRRELGGETPNRGPTRRS